MLLDLFRDKARVSLGRDSIAVTFTHWARRSKSFSFNFQGVREVEAVQVEPARMHLNFVLEDGTRRFISEEMAGWSDSWAHVQSYFVGFDCDAYERAKGDINRVYLCWKRG